MMMRMRVMRTMKMGMRKQEHQECWDEPKVQGKQVPRQACWTEPKEYYKKVPGQVCSPVNMEEPYYLHDGEEELLEE